jgi:hypothetical protein
MLKRSALFSVVVSIATLASACSPAKPEPTPQGPTWSQLFARLPGALISIWGSNANNLWTVGGDAGDGDGPMAMHFDGSQWTRHLTGKTGDLWWVHGFEDGPVFMGGSSGAIQKYQGGTFETMKTPAAIGTVFGIWGASADDVWAVGGAGSTPTGGFIWHYDGKAWAPHPAAPMDLADTATVFKVWGTGKNDVWFVGTGGLVLHFDGKAMASVTVPTDQTLFTLSGANERLYAVGADGIVLENDGKTWTNAAPNNKQQMNGVAARGDDAWAVGVFGGVLHRDAGTWASVKTGLLFQDDYHGVWLDPDGGVWCVGGQVAALPLVEGTLAYYGAADIPGTTFVTQQ